MILSAALALSSCGASSLEDYMVSNEDQLQELQADAESMGMELEVSGNDIIFNINVHNFTELHESAIQDGSFEEAYKPIVDDSADTFVNVCTQYEKETGIDGIRVIVRYSYDDTELFSRVFDANGIVEDDGGSAEDTGEAEDN